MNKHEPSSYKCPFCSLVNGKETEHNKLTDVIYEDSQTIAFVSPRWWPNNPGVVLVIPREHVENIYNISDRLLSQIYVVGKSVALAVRKTYDCQGVSMRQHNEPAGNQDVWHFHLQVLPRYENDKLYQQHDEARLVNEKERKVYVMKLNEYFKSNKK